MLKSGTVTYTDADEWSVQVSFGWPASFIIVYDEAWILVQLLSAIMSSSTGGNSCMMDLVAWHVDPSGGQSGFTPHRDRHLGTTDATETL